MVTYTVHEPLDPAADRVDRASELRFIKDGFSWWTAIFPPLGLAMKKLWLPLFVYLAATAALLAGLNWMDAGATPQAIIFTSLALYLGFEVSSIERWMLDRAGWTTLGTVTGRNIAECERRFYETWLPDQPIITAKREPGSPSRSPWALGSRA